MGIVIQDAILKPMPKIFISYRRLDSTETTTRLYDRLAYAFEYENVFKDVDSIQRGDNFPDVLRDHVNNCEVFLAVIGKQWLTIQDGNGRRRIDNKDDWVRQETEMALIRDKNVVLIPILVNGASLPVESALPDSLCRLIHRDTQVLRPEYFHQDVSSLITSIRKRFGLSLQVPQLNMNKLHADLFEMIIEKQWDAARTILIKLRSMEQVPIHFRLDAIEQGIYKKILEEQRIVDYSAVMRIANLVDVGFLAYEEVKEAVRVFLQNYDSFPSPDSARLLRYVSSPEITPITNKSTFLSTSDAHSDNKYASRESDIAITEWIPRIVTFKDIHIADLRFCYVPTGTFEMGSSEGYHNNEHPPHTQIVEEAFWISQFPVTNAQWKYGVEANIVSLPEGDLALVWYRDANMANVPVVGISWSQAFEFAIWLGCRLPTELEWEYSARGSQSFNYPWGNDWDETACIWAVNSDNQVALVETKPEGRSWVGARHMIGNVWEWTSSAYEPYPYIADDGREFYSIEPSETQVRHVLEHLISENTTSNYEIEDLDQINDLPHKINTINRNVYSVRRVLRGGSWFDTKSNILRSACRGGYNPTYSSVNWGFRLARSFS